MNPCYLQSILADFKRNATQLLIFQGTDRRDCCMREAPYLITNDNVAEPDEILTISIAQGIASSSIPVDFAVQQVNITLIDDDGE